MPKIIQGYVDFGRFDRFNYFVAGSGQSDFVQVRSFCYSIFWFLGEQNKNWVRILIRKLRPGRVEN